MKVTIIQHNITWEAAHVAIRAAVAKAELLGIKINVAISDVGGNLAAFLRMPNAFIPSIQIAIDKATTAAGFGFPTADWMKVCGDDESMKLGFSAQPNVIVFGGGLPIRVDGELIGGIGVSGGSAEQDEECAKAALKLLCADCEVSR